jgi:hypothetical protein
MPTTSTGLCRSSLTTVFWKCRAVTILGNRYTGLAAVKEGLRTRLVGIPDVRYTDDTHFVAGDIGVSEWTLRGTAVGGENIEVRGCDFFTFANDGKILKKNSYWKIRDRA